MITAVAPDISVIKDPDECGDSHRFQIDCNLETIQLIVFLTPEKLKKVKDDLFKSKSYISYIDDSVYDTEYWRPLGKFIMNQVQKADRELQNVYLRPTNAFTIMIVDVRNIDVTK